MKRIFAVLLVSIVFVNVSTFASEGLDRRSSAKRFIDGLGELGGSIGRTEFPIIGQLKNLLPFAIAGYCFDQHPRQTMITLTGLLIYVLYTNDNVRSALRKYTMVEENTKTEKANKVKPKTLELDDSFFDFEGDVDLDQNMAYSDLSFL